MSNLSTLRDLLYRYRAAWLVVSIFVLDCWVVGPAIGQGKTLAQVWNQPWLAVRPFIWSGRPIDVLVLSLASSQVGLLAVWAFFSRRMRVIRVVCWLAGAVFWSMALLLLYNAGHNLFEVTWLFVSESLGVVAGLVLMRLGGYHMWQSAGRGAGDGPPPLRQHSLAELMLVFVVIGVVCVFISWLNKMWGFDSFVWGWRSRDVSTHAARSVRLAVFGSFASFAVWTCLTERLTVWRIGLVLLFAGAAGWAMVSVSQQYHLFVELSGFAETSIMDWVVWAVLHTMLQLAVLLVVRGFGYRLAVPPQARSETSGVRGKLHRLARRAVLAAILAGTAVVVFYTFVVALPAYRANRNLVVRTSHIGAIYSLRYRGQVHMNVEHPLDDAAVDALRSHPIVTHLRVYNFNEGDGTLERLRELPFLQGVRFVNPGMSDATAKQLMRDLPNTSIDVWRRK